MEMEDKEETPSNIYELFKSISISQIMCEIFTYNVPF